jgi:hypothetical protein
MSMDEYDTISSLSVFGDIVNNQLVSVGVLFTCIVIGQASEDRIDFCIFHL